jgi:hypothetical protein
LQKTTPGLGNEPKGQPMNVGQLMKTGKNDQLKFDFQSQPRLLNNPQPGAAGRELLQETKQKQIKIKNPEGWEKAAKEENKALEEQQKAISRYNDIKKN